MKITIQQEEISYDEYDIFTGGIKTHYAAQKTFTLKSFKLFTYEKIVELKRDPAGEHLLTIKNKSGFFEMKYAIEFPDEKNVALYGFGHVKSA